MPFYVNIYTHAFNYKKIKTVLVVFRFLKIFYGLNNDE